MCIVLAGLARVQGQPEVWRPDYGFRQRRYYNQSAQNVRFGVKLAARR